MNTRQMIWILALGLAALPAYGQTSQPTQSQQPAQKPAQKAKKVWTNEDLAELSANAPVSTASATAPAEGPAGGEVAQPGAEKPAAKPAQLPPEKDPKVYKDKLDALQKRLADVEAKIKSTQDAMSGSQGGSNALNLSQATPILRPADQLEALEKERKDIQQQIEDLESQAKQNGLGPGEIR